MGDGNDTYRPVRDYTDADTGLSAQGIFKKGPLDRYMLRDCAIRVVQLSCAAPKEFAEFCQDV